MIDFFYYSFLDGMLMGSEDPGNFGYALDVVKELCDNHNIKHMITLTPEHTEFNLPGLSQYHFPMYDIPSKQDVIQLFSIIDGALKNREAVLVHCKQGIDRTGCVIGSYLVQKGHDPNEIIEALLSKFRKRLLHLNVKKLWQDKIEFIKSYSREDKIK